MPGLAQVAGNTSFGKDLHHFFTNIGHGALAKISKLFRGPFIEVAVRHRRIRFSLFSQESFDVSSIFLHQRQRAVLRMALKVYEQASAFLLDENVYARLRRLRQYAITTRGEFFHTNLIPPRVWEPYEISNAAEQLVIARSLVVKDPESLVRQRVALDPITVKDAGM